MRLFLALFLCAAVAHGGAELDTTLQEPILAPGTTLAEFQTFVLERRPSLDLPPTSSDWTRQANSLRKKLLDDIVYRGVPSSWRRGPANIEWTEDIESGKGYRIRKLRYEAVPGMWIPAVLYEPTDHDGPMPAVLNVNGHVGKPAKGIAYEQIRCINLAKRGVLALHPEWLVFGELEHAGNQHNKLAYLDLCGVSGLSVFYNAMKRGLDVLWDYPTTDHDRVAMTGLSGGGWQTIILSSLDTRIGVSVPNAGYSGIDTRVRTVADIGDLEQIPADLLGIADYQHLTAMLAPRPALLIYNAQDECCFKAERAKPSIYDPIVPFYDLYGNAGEFEFYTNVDPGTHNYELDNRQQFYRFVNMHFALGANDTEISCEGEVYEPEKLHVGIPKDNATFTSLAAEFMRDLPKRSRISKRSLTKIIAYRPQLASGSQIGSAEVEGLTIARYVFRTDEWSVPGLVVESNRMAPHETVLLVADAGKASQGGAIARLAMDGKRVIAIDPTFVGESRPDANSPWQFAMIVNATSAQVLGEQVAQIVSIADWACGAFETPRVSMHANGWNSSVAATMACAIANDSFSRLTIEDGLDSFKRLIEAERSYNDHVALFCFGLLEATDISGIRKLCRGVEISS